MGQWNSPAINMDIRESRRNLRTAIERGSRGERRGGRQKKEQRPEDHTESQEGFGIIVSSSEMSEGRRKGKGAPLCNPRPSKTN